MFVFAQLLKFNTSHFLLDTVSHLFVTTPFFCSLATSSLLDLLLDCLSFEDARRFANEIHIDFSASLSVIEWHHWLWRLALLPWAWLLLVLQVWRLIWVIRVSPTFVKTTPASISILLTFWYRLFAVAFRVLAWVFTAAVTRMTAKSIALGLLSSHLRRPLCKAIVPRVLSLCFILLDILISGVPYPQALPSLQWMLKG